MRQQISLNLVLKVDFVPRCSKWNVASRLFDSSV
jgi:hypothetical protein